MTTPHPSPSRLPAGTFIVRDSADERAISALLARHRVKGSSSAPAGSARERQELRAAEHRLLELEATYEQTQQLLARAVADLEAERTARREEHDQKYSRLVDTEAALARADLTINAMEAELATARDEASKPTPIGAAASVARDEDRAAFAALADRLDREAVAKSKVLADVLRLAARAVRDEITTVYGSRKAAS